MFLLVTCQHMSGTCQSHFCLALSLRKVPWKYVELSPNTPPFLTLQFCKKDLTPTPNLVQIWPIPPPLRHILSFLPIRFFSLLSPCWFFICGGKCRKLPRYVPYKCTYVPYNGTFGTPDQGQTLDVWGWHLADVNPEEKIHLRWRFPTSSSRKSQIRKILQDKNQYNNTRSHG